MSAMELFHVQVHPNEENQNPYLRALTQLTQAGLDQLKALEGVPSWDDWFPSEA